MDFIKEKDGDLTNPQQWGKSPTRMTSINFDAYLHEEAKKFGIGLKDALEFGIRFLVADKDGFNYPDCNLQNKLHKVVAHRNALLKEIEGLREQIPKSDDFIDEDKEVDGAKEFDKLVGDIKNE